MSVIRWRRARRSFSSDVAVQPRPASLATETELPMPYQAVCERHLAFSSSSVRVDSSQPRERNSSRMSWMCAGDQSDSRVGSRE